MILILDLLYGALSVLMIAYIVFSLARVSPYHKTFGPFVVFVNRLVEPILAPVRNMLGTSLGGLDFSPMIVLLAAGLLRSILTGLLI